MNIINKFNKMYKQVIKHNINIQEFFEVYPTLVKVYSDESHKYIKLFEEPKKRGFKNKAKKNNEELDNNTISVRRIGSAKELELLNNGFKKIRERNDLPYKRSNSLDENVKKSNIDLEEQLIEKGFIKKYFLINKGLELQRTKKKRTHSIRRALQNFLYNTNVIEKLNDNLYSIENKLNNSILSKNAEKKLEEKISNKIYNIVEKLSTKLTIEKVPENKFVIKYNGIGDKCYFLLSGKLSIMKPVEYKNIQLTTKDYIRYLLSLTKFDETDLLNKVIDLNHIHLNIESIQNLKIIAKVYFKRKLNNFLETFKTLTKEDFLNALDEYNLKFEDFKLNPKKTLKDIEDINNNCYQENKDNYSDSDGEENLENTRSKYAILKGYLNKFSLNFKERIAIISFNFLFNRHEEKKLYNFTLYKYEYFLNLFPGSFFGDMALENKGKRRNATIRTEEECIILSLDNEDYLSLLYEDNKKLKSMDLLFLSNKFFLNEISPILFEKYYFAKFKFFEKYKGDVIYRQDDEFTSVLFLKKGCYKLEMKASVIDFHNLIKFLIDMLEEKNYLKYSNQYINELKETYLKDQELIDLRMKNIIYKEKFNEKHKLEISTINQYEVLGDLELFLTSGYINTCTITSQKAEYFEIKKRDLNDIFRDQKDVLPSFHIFVMNKLISHIKRFFYLKMNLKNQIKSKIENNFYQPLISLDFSNQIKNNKTNTYFFKKLKLKKLIPPAFKYAHYTPPVIYDSRWKQKSLEHEKNEVSNNYQSFLLNKREKEKEREKENNLKLSTSKKDMNKTEIKKEESTNETKNETHRKKKKFFRNKKISKIFEEAFTSKTYNNSTIDANLNNEEQKKKERSQKKFDINNIFPFNTNNRTIVVGKYHLSLEKITNEMKNFGNYDPFNLNLVKNIINEKATIVPKSFKNNTINKYLSLSSSKKHILPQIGLYKQRHFINPFRKKENLSEIFNITNSIENSNITYNDRFKKRNKLELTQAVKNFYRKQKEIGYSSVVNRKNNRYYQLGRDNFYN